MKAFLHNAENDEKKGFKKKEKKFLHKATHLTCKTMYYFKLCIVYVSIYFVVYFIT